jgi:hypothetical protein
VWLAFAGLASGEDIPTSITHDILPAGQNRYCIHGLYIKNAHDALLTSDYYQREIPQCVSLSVDPTNRTMAFVTHGAVTNLQQLCDQFAHGGGMVPYWEELQIRDRKSRAFDAHLYTVTLQQSLPWPDDSGPGLLAVTNEIGQLRLTFFSCRSYEGSRSFLLDYVLSQTNETYSLRQSGERRWISWQALEPMIKGKLPSWRSHPLRYAPGRVGRVAINKATAYCMCYPLFSLRVFDSTGNFIWEDQTNVYGTAYLAVADLTHDGIDEIVAYQEEHGKTHFTVFERMNKEKVSNQAPEATP